MITAIVTYPLPASIGHEACKVHFETIAPGFAAVPGLIRKQFIWNETGKAGGVYLCTTSKWPRPSIKGLGSPAFSNATARIRISNISKRSQLPKHQTAKEVLAANKCAGRSIFMSELQLPVLDLNRLALSGGERDAFLSELHQSARRFGFFYATGHGIPHTEVQPAASSI